MLLLIQYTLIFASVLVLVALGGCFSEHSGVINLGLEGIMVIGALGGALMMRYMPGTMGAFPLILCVLLGAIVFGVAYSALLGVACINFKADQTIVGTALNMLASRRRPCSSRRSTPRRTRTMCPPPFSTWRRRRSSS